jgi:putative glutamine amidotransferase
MSRPLIGITIGPDRPGSPYVQLRSSYSSAIESAGGPPVLIPPLAREAGSALVHRLDGVIFPGGPDVDPALYGEPAPKPKPVLGWISSSLRWLTEQSARICQRSVFAAASSY